MGKREASSSSDDAGSTSPKKKAKLDEKDKTKVKKDSASLWESVVNVEQTAETCFVMDSGLCCKFQWF